MDAKRIAGFSLISFSQTIQKTRKSCLVSLIIKGTLSELYSNVHVNAGNGNPR